MYEQQQEQPQNISVPYNQMQEGLLQYQLDPSEIIMDIQASLLGKKQVYNTKTMGMEWKSMGKELRLINDKGMNALLIPLQSRLTKIFVLSDLGDDQIENMTVEIAHNIIDTLYEHWQEYEVKSIPSASMIVGLITDAVYATLCKAKNHNYLSFLKTAQRIVETQQYRVGGPEQQAQQQPSGRLGRMLGFGKMFAR